MPSGKVMGSYAPSRSLQNLKSTMKSSTTFVRELGMLMTSLSTTKRGTIKSKLMLPNKRSERASNSNLSQVHLLQNL